ncbi:MAG: cob(I)yrinic acid a,c-diamide adenosyltransferase [Epulopiscium sp. Nele67-Bin004]|nr:MAG: cob(I)yrinic acid a,c-diamide adenosyltransferase [Epulopiscium sp. Nele67-Bin004]
MNTGLIQVYCGDGKGKSTAAIGLGIRAIGSGLKVIMIQFLKQDTTGEVKMLKTLEPNFKVFHFEKQHGFVWTLSDEEKAELKKEICMAMKFAKKVMDTGECDVLILDEILGAVETGLVTEAELLDLVENKNEHVELVLTGRKLPDEIKDIADYVSKIEGVKHPYEKGIGARKGIEY